MEVFTLTFHVDVKSFHESERSDLTLGSGLGWFVIVLDIILKI